MNRKNCEKAPRAGARRAAVLGRVLTAVLAVVLMGGLGAPEALASETNPEYQAVFEGARVIHLPFMLGMDMECFAMRDEDGNIVCQDYGYRDDQVLTYVETWYYFGIPADQTVLVEALNGLGEEEVARFAEVSCARVTYEYMEGSEVFKVRYEFTKLDQPENCQALYDLGIATGTGGLSMAKCEENALASGFKKK